MTVKQKILCASGILLTGLGAIGAVVPLLPAFPFLLGALVCFAKSSPRFHSWFIATKLYKHNLESYVQKRAMTVKTKVTLVISLTITMGIGFIAMHRVPVGRMILCAVWIFHIFYFIFGIKTAAPIKRTPAAHEAERL